MKNHIRKLLLLCMAVLPCILLGGCANSVNYAISNDAIAISDPNANTYVNPADSEDSYGCIELNQVTYLPYGVQSKPITSKEVGACIAYSSVDSNERYYTVLGNENFIAQYYVNGEMEQFTFLRRADTIGEDIVIPDFIEDLGYKIWQ